MTARRTIQKTATLTSHGNAEDDHSVSNDVTTLAQQDWSALGCSGMGCFGARVLGRERLGVRP